MAPAGGGAGLGRLDWTGLDWGLDCLWLLWLLCTAWGGVESDTAEGGRGGGRGAKVRGYRWGETRGGGGGEVWRRGPESWWAGGEGAEGARPSHSGGAADKVGKQTGGGKIGRQRADWRPGR